MEKNVITGNPEIAFEYIAQSLLPMAVFVCEGDNIGVKVISRGFAALCNPNKSIEEIMQEIQEDVFAYVHPDYVEYIKKTTYKFMTEDAEYDVMFKTKGTGFGTIKNVHGCGYHEYKEDGSRYAIITYEDITPHIRKEREKAGKLQTTISNLINNDDYAIAIVAEDTHELLLYNAAMEAIIPPANFFTTGMTFEEYFYGSKAKRNNIFEVLVDKGEKLYVDPYTNAEMAIKVSMTEWNGQRAYYIKGSTTVESYYDGLTKLPNRSFFIERGSVLYRQLFAQGLKPHIVYMNMKALRYYNNAFGFEDGNRILIGMAMILRKAFPNQLIARFAADHFFMLIDDEPDENLLKEIAEEIRDLGNMAIEVKFGYVDVPEDATELTELIDYAKTAYVSIKNSLDTISIKYLPSMNEDSINKKYVIENIDRAIARGHIKVYYQPVVRTLTGKVCGAEALARWVDPKKGVLNVGTVISALEESHQIHKLDCSIIEQVCKEYRDCVDEGRVPVPVSVNLSRLDFVCCDIFSSIERSRRKYSVPRNMINLEITESVFGSETSVRNVVSKFREVGYQVWMDDFGSGYSSLNLLKEFSFDEVKLDMEFLSNFSDKGKSIIRSTIDMAKDIGIYTLAEGVETPEQYEFLKKIGCEKVQGFLFERPLPYDQFLDSCAKKNLEMEEPIWREYYDEIGKTRFISDKPVTLVEYNNDSLKTLFMNYLFQEYIENNKPYPLEELDNHLNEGSAIYKAIKRFVASPNEVGDSFFVSILDNDNYVKFKISCVAKCAGRYMFFISIENVSDNESGDMNKHTDNVIRNLYYLFDSVSIINLGEDTIEEIFADDSFKVTKQGAFADYGKRVPNFANNYVQAEDQERFIEFVDPSTIETRMRESDSTHLSEYFRIKSVKGDYVWKLVSFIKIVGKNDKEIISCIREVPSNRFDSPM